mmetsp:Transcript_22461/g.70735  ORF Transcript_22461/g.70735 Transcript_22461/m.70735 type:complete len:360 (-) Transcript_22461:1-1080(-)
MLHKSTATCAEEGHAREKRSEKTFECTSARLGSSAPKKAASRAAHGHPWPPLSIQISSEAELLDRVLARCQLRRYDARDADHGEAAVVELPVAHVHVIHAEAEGVTEVADLLVGALLPDLLQDSAPNEDGKEADLSGERVERAGAGREALRTREPQEVLPNEADGSHHRHAPVLQLGLPEDPEVLLLADLAEAEGVEVPERSHRPDLSSRVKRRGRLAARCRRAHQPPVLCNGTPGGPRAPQSFDGGAAGCEHSTGQCEPCDVGGCSCLRWRSLATAANARFTGTGRGLRHMGRSQGWSNECPGRSGVHRRERGAERHGACHVQGADHAALRLALLCEATGQGAGFACGAGSVGQVPEA